MKLNLRLQIVIVLLLSLMSPLAQAAPAGIGPSFKGPIGLQLYSLRDQFAKDVPGTLDTVKKLGFTDVELAGTYGLSPEQYRAPLVAHGLRAVSGYFPFGVFQTNLGHVIPMAD